MATFDRLLTHLRSPDPDPATVHDLLDVAWAAARELRQLSERVSCIDGVIHFDGHPLDNALSRHLVRLIRSGDRSYPALVRFMENLSANPSGRSRAQLSPGWPTGHDPHPGRSLHRPLGCPPR